MGAPDYLHGLFEESASITVDEVLFEAGDDPVHQREQLARIVLDQMYQFVALLDPAGTLLEVNRAALAGGGIKAEDIIGKPFWRTHWWTVSQETQEQLRQAISRAAAGELVRHDVEVYGEKTGSEAITFDFSLFPVRNRHGKVVFLLAAGRNITEKKRAESEIARKNAELQRLKAEVATRSENLELLTKEVLQQKRQLQTALDETRVARERAEEAAQTREYFLQLVSHELRTPITSVGLTLDLLRSRGAHRGNERLFERLASGTKRLDNLVSNLLEWARIESGRLTVEAEPLDPAVIAAEVAEELEPMRQRPVVLRLDASPDLGLFWMDARLLRLIFSNLLGNALKYTPEGEVALSLHREGEHLLIAVSDTGPGIPEGDRRRVFEPFAQLQPIHQKSIPGVGLGLALVREIVESLAGSLELSCPPAGGSRFVVKLPSHTATAHVGR